MYKFQESEIKHGERLGNFHHVRQLRHAILTIYNGASYSKTPAYLLNKPVEELLREAGVTLRGKEFVLAAIPLKENIMTRAANWFGSTDQKQGEKTRIRVSQGKAPSKVPYPYIETSDGIDVDRDIRELLVNAFDLLRDHCATYTRVAEYLNSSDFPTATGGEWN